MLPDLQPHGCPDLGPSFHLGLMLPDLVDVLLERTDMWLTLVGLMIELPLANKSTDCCLPFDIEGKLRLLVGADIGVPIHLRQTQGAIGLDHHTHHPMMSAMCTLIKFYPVQGGSSLILFRADQV